MQQIQKQLQEILKPIFHIRHLEDELTYYHLNVYEWTSCLIGDSYNLNLCIARSMELPQMGCSNHKLNLEVLKMIDNSSHFSETLSTVREIMQSFRSSSNSRAVLESLTNLSPVLPCQTRWSGYYQMIDRFLKIRDSLQQIAEMEEFSNSITVPNSSICNARCNRIVRQLSEVNYITVEQQKKGCTLENCRYLLDALVESIQKHKNNVSSNLYLCSLQSDYISLPSNH